MMVKPTKDRNVLCAGEQPGARREGAGGEAGADAALLRGGDDHRAHTPGPAPGQPRCLPALPPPPAGSR